MNNIVYRTDPAICTRVYDPSGPAAVNYNFIEEQPKKPEVPGYNKHRDGLWPNTDLQREYIKVQRERYIKNLRYLYSGYQAKLIRRQEELGWDMAKVEAEEGPEVMAQAENLYYSHIWRKEAAHCLKSGYLSDIYYYWRDISHGLERKEYDHLWEYVAERRLPVKLMTAPGEYEPRAICRLKPEETFEESFEKLRLTS